MINSSKLAPVFKICSHILLITVQLRECSVQSSVTCCRRHCGWCWRAWRASHQRIQHQCTL